MCYSQFRRRRRAPELEQQSNTVHALTYRCPVCGNMVDATNAEQILLHHEHVTHPRRFLQKFQAA